MSRPRLLDLFCKAGGAGMGYSRAGFDVIGVDIEEQPNYPFEFWQADALEVLEAGGVGPWLIEDFDAIHASPPCQAYTSLRALGKSAGTGAPELIAPVRLLLHGTGLPYVIENVEGARGDMVEPLRICGSSFHLGVRRHRWFETNFPMMTLSCAHGSVPRPIAVYGDHPEDSKRDNLNRARTLQEGAEAMGIDWMTWAELTQAVPPAYTEFIGYALMAALPSRQRAYLEQETRA